MIVITMFKNYNAYGLNIFSGGFHCAIDVVLVGLVKKYCFQILRGTGFWYGWLHFTGFIDSNYLKGSDI